MLLLVEKLQKKSGESGSRIFLIFSGNPPIPLGLVMVNEELQNEHMKLIGAKHDCKIKLKDK